jgi:hypothetical protein
MSLSHEASQSPQEPAASAARPASAARRVLLKRFGLTFAGLGIAICLFAGFAGARANKAHASPKAHKPAAGLRTPAHIETWAFDDGCNGGVGAHPTLVRQWVTFAESDCGPTTTKARRDCHSGSTIFCTVMQYLDTDWNYRVEKVPVHRASDASWWLHEPSPHQRVRIFSSGFGGGHLVNQTNPAVRSFFRSYARRHYNSDDGLLLDWQSPSLLQELYYSNCRCTTTSEIRSNTVLRAAHEKMSAELTHNNGAPFIQADNTLPPNPYTPQGLDMLNHSTGVDGWVVEGEPMDYGAFDPYYSTLLDQIAYVATRTRAFVVPMTRAAAGARNQMRTRRVAEATMLLGYSPGHLVDWANLETGSRDLAVWPEEGIYPTDPLQSMRAPGGRGCLAGTGKACSSGGHNSLEVAPGVYRREFGACYDRGVRFGRCAAIVNTRGRPVTVRSSWLRRSYGHRITFRGGDVQSRGTIDLTGSQFRAGSTTVASYDAILLAP